MKGYNSNSNCSKTHSPLTDLFLLLTIACYILGAFSNALALGTPSGTTVSLGATADYQVGDEDMPTVSTASPAQFMVDTLVDLTVAETGGYASVTPRTSDQVLTFTVENTGNASQDFALSAATITVGSTDPLNGANTVDFTATNLQVFVDDGSGAYEAGTDTTTFIDELAANATITVFIVADIPDTALNEGVAACTLTATAHNAGGSGSLGVLTQENSGDANDTSLDAANADVVFGDGSGLSDIANNGDFSAADAFMVTSATLTISKSSTVISDPFNSTANPKMIPGAVVEYTVTVTNGSDAGENAVNIVVEDDLTAEITNIAFDPDAYGSGLGIRYAINDGGYTALTNASDTDDGSYASNTVSVSSIDLTPGDHADIQFRVVIQ